MISAVRWFVRVNRSASAGLLRAFPSIFDGPSYFSNLTSRIAEDIAKNRPAVVLEVGGVDRPMLDRNPSFCYVGVDLSYQPNCVNLYDKFIVQSIEDPLPFKADIIISITLLEHVPNNIKSIKSMYEALNSGGFTYHYIPSGFHPYSIALRLIGPKLQRRFIPLLRPGTEDVTGYPAFFHKCTPSAMEKNFRSAGFTEILITPFYRANDYFAFFVPVFIVVSLFENLCSVLGLKLFASGFIVSAKRA